MRGDDFKRELNRLHQVPAGTPGAPIATITGPPCADCEHWRPGMITNSRGDFDGVVLCTRVGDMCNDFSCFRAKAR